NRRGQKQSLPDRSQECAPNRSLLSRLLRQEKCTWQAAPATRNKTVVHATKVACLCSGCWHNSRPGFGRSTTLQTLTRPISRKRVQTCRFAWRLAMQPKSRALREKAELCRKELAQAVYSPGWQVPLHGPPIKPERPRAKYENGASEYRKNQR